jgi:uncharacterized protein YfaP (DUF2135 family)
MKKLLLFLFVSGIVISCSSDSTTSDTNNLAGQDGNPRFNLQFTNSENVDLDLYVKTPSGAIISYSNRTADAGTLDVDCLCGSCASGPNENIFWVNGTAPTGQYEYWVNYYNNCGTSGSASSFTLRVIKNGTIITTQTGTLSAQGNTTHWTYTN